MPKPVTLPRWSTDQTNMDTPSSGQADTGWTPNQMGVSDYDNFIKFWTYKWTEWLNGIVAGGSNQLVQMSSAGDLSASNTLAANMTFDNVTVSQKFMFTGDRVMNIPAAAALPGSALWSFVAGVWTVGDTTYLNYPVVVEDGYRITNFGVYYNKGSNGSTTLFFDFVRVDNATGTLVVVGSTNDADNAPGNTNKIVGVNHTMLITDTYYIRVTSNTGSALDSFRGVEIQYDRPA